MKNNLQVVRRNLRDLIRTLPAVRDNCSAEVVKRHLDMIAYFQRQYDLLIASERAMPALG